MKKYLAVLTALTLFASALEASAQGINATVNVNANAGKTVGVGANATATINQSKNDDKASSTNAQVKNEVSAAAREIRGWDENEKTEFLATVKAHAQLKSSQDLDNFAKGVMIEDENVDAVAAGEESVEVRYKLPARFLGVFGTEISAVTNVTFESDRTGRGPKEVTVSFPWYKMFFSLDEETREDVLEAAIEQSVVANAQVPRDNHYAQNGRAIQLISNILKGIRAELEASSEVEAQ